ncbi:MAG: hypothetical protein ACXWWC_11905 [Chitinophagaceae bacterium]
MKKLLLLLLACGMFASAYPQSTPVAPCCNIIARDVKNNLVVARDITTGRLTFFKTDNLDIKAISKGDAVNVNWQTKKVTAISGALRNYPVIQPDKAEPVSILAVMRIDNVEPINTIVTPKINTVTPINDIVSIQVDNAEPPSGIVTPKINNADPVNGIITAQGKSGKTFQFKVPAAIAKTLKIGDPAYIEPINGIQINYLDPVNGIQVNSASPINDFAIVQSSHGSSNGQMASYGYPATSGEGTTGNENATDKWVITPVTNMKGVLGRLDINFPADVERNILIYQPVDNKFITSVSRNDKTYTIAPGEYRFTITNVPVENVPIQKGHETRLKMGFLNVVSEGDWHLYNETKEKAFTSGNKAKKLPLPVGSYQLKLGTQFYPFTIKDRETVEY